MAQSPCRSSRDRHPDRVGRVRHHHRARLSNPSADSHCLDLRHPCLAERQARACRLLGILCPTG